jgi:hypothetical protein
VTKFSIKKRIFLNSIMIIPEQFDIEIDRELARAREAQSSGNAGKVRTAARRAAGCAVRYWLEKYPHDGYPADIMQQIRRFSTETQIPLQVREALLRLETRISTAFESPSTDPLTDASIIISYIRSEIQR